MGTTQNQVFQLKGGLFTLTVMHLNAEQLSDIEKQVADTVSQAPKFFEYAPIVVDLNELGANAKHLDLVQLKSLLERYKLILIGIKSKDKAIKEIANKSNIAIFSQPSANKPTAKPTKKLTSPKKTELTQAKACAVNEPNFAKVIVQPVRSGQQIYAKNSDLIILSSVSHGAEVLADGHIHIYGPLRGRALAGVMGNKNARIFCKSMDAELISICGHYLVSEQLSQYKDKGATQIHLENDQLIILEH